MIINKNKIPWWIKIILKIIISRLPGNYEFWQKFGLFRHGSMDNHIYAFKVFKSHIDKVNGWPIDGKKILEIGPGDGISTAIIAASYNASAVLIDSVDHVNNDIDLYIELCSFLKDQSLNPPLITKKDTVGSILQKCNSRYLTDGVDSFAKVDTDSIDIVFSQAVLEHIEKDIFAREIKECFRVSKNKSVSSHEVDLRDHLSENLNNLRFSEKIWESSFFKSSGFYTNRIQLEEMKSFFTDAGFRFKIISVDSWDALPIKKEKLNKYFRSLSDENLKVKVFNVLLYKDDSG